MSNEVYWFRRKRSGLGWGLPCSSQGWIFFTIWLGAVAFAVFHFMPQSPLSFTAALTVLAIILVAVCYIKGEPLG